LHRPASGVVALVAWIVGIPFVSGILVVVGGFMFLMAVYTFVREGGRAIHDRRTPADEGAGDGR